MENNLNFNQKNSFKKYFVITPSINFFSKKINLYFKNNTEIGKKFSKPFSYNSRDNENFLDISRTS